jgi:hypothetical protein
VVTAQSVLEPVASSTACQMKAESAMMSHAASQMWLLSAGERVLKLGRPNSDWRGQNS